MHPAVFTTLVYVVATCLILTRNSVSVNACGWVILVAHAYKDVTNMAHWPKWCDVVGIMLACTLISGGTKIRSMLAVLVGSLKLAAHVRQLIFNNNRYYY